MSPVVATANTAVAAIDRLKERGANDIRVVCMIASPEGVERLRGIHPDVKLWTAAITIIWMAMRSSFPAWATPATAPTARNKRHDQALENADGVRTG